MTITLDKKRFMRTLFISIIVAFVVSILIFTGFLNTWEARVSDALYTPSSTMNDIVIIAIDDGSLQDLGRWPWSRDLFAKVIDNLNQSRVIGIDISFFEPFDIQIAYGRVITSNYTQRINAVNFAESQIGKPYNSRELKDPNPNSNAWYCSELVWAAYLSQGIDLDRNGWNFPKYVTPLEICWDDDVEMYTYNELNNWYTGFYLSWFINYILNWPINHQF